MNLIHLRYFAELAHTGHYTRAAERLCITQPSLSHAISQLEEELGVALFEKSGRNTRLTCFGQQFLSCAESALQTLDEGVEALRQGARGAGLIRLGILRPLGIRFIPELVSSYLKARPELELKFTFDSGVTGQLLEGLEKNHYDLVFCSKPEREQDFRIAAAARQRLKLIVPADHPLAGRKAVRLKETLDYPYVYFSAISWLRPLLYHIFSKSGAVPSIAYEVQEDEVAAGLAAQGFGIAIVPEMELLEHLKIWAMDIDEPGIERNIYMVARGQGYMTPAVSQFWNYVESKGIALAAPVPNKEH